MRRATAAQPEMLQLLLARHAPVEQLDGAVRALVAQQCRCGWPTIVDAASALVALSSYAAEVKPVPGIGNGTHRQQNDRHGAIRQYGVIANVYRERNDSRFRQCGAVLMVRASYYTVLYTYPVPVDAPGAARGVSGDPNAQRFERVGCARRRRRRWRRSISAAGGAVSVDSARVFDIGVRTIVDHPVDRLVIEDPLPAGFEAVDTSFRTTLQAIVPQSDSWQIDTTQIYRDRVIAYASHLDPGVYDFHYLVRSVTPGTFRWPGARAYLENAPEQFGRSAGGVLTVR